MTVSVTRKLSKFHFDADIFLFFSLYMEISTLQDLSSCKQVCKVMKRWPPGYLLCKEKAIGDHLFEKSLSIVCALQTPFPSARTENLKASMRSGVSVCSAFRQRLLLAYQSFNRIFFHSSFFLKCAVFPVLHTKSFLHKIANNSPRVAFSIPQHSWHHQDRFVKPLQPDFVLNSLLNATVPHT